MRRGLCVEIFLGVGKRTLREDKRKGEGREFPKVRYKGLKKNTAQLITLFALSNLWMARHKLMALPGCVRLEIGQMA